MDIETAQESFVNLLGRIEPNAKLKFLEWVCREYNPHYDPDSNFATAEEKVEPDMLDEIASSLCASMNPTDLAVGDGHSIRTDASCNITESVSTLHVDSFLYPSEDDVDELLGALGIGRYHCLECGSWKTSPLEFISHSMSKDEVKFIFNNLVPNLSGKTVVDVGSRLGPVLYGGYVYSQASQLVGIEIASSFCDLQNRVISQRNLSDRVRVVHSDVRQQKNLLLAADVVVLNNAFEFFCSLAEQADIWEFLYHSLRKKGSLIVSRPSIPQSCEKLTFKTSLQLDDWVREIDFGLPPHEDLADIHLYCVI